MQDWGTPIAMTVLTGLALAGGWLGLRRLREPGPGRAPGAVQATLWGCAAGAGLLLLYRWAVASSGWGPLGSHADGLALMGGLLAATVAFLQWRGPFAGLGAFASPLLVLLFAWGICASLWTWRPFAIHSLWTVVHLAAVYAGTGLLAVGAGAGGLYLYVRRRLARKAPLGAVARLAPLEATERLIVGIATPGFALLTLGLVTGLVVVEHTGPHGLGPGWWHSPKVLVGTGAWAVYALVINVRHASRFRGARAAWLSIVGFALLVTTFGLVMAMADGRAGGAP